LAFIAACQVLAAKLNAPAHSCSGVIEQPKDCQSQRALPRSTLAHKAHNFTGKNFNAGGS